MEEDLDDIEIRLSVLESLVDFLFAAQHMQTNDPAAAVLRLRSLLLERMASAGPLGDDRQAKIAAAMERSVQRIAALQTQLPRRLVD